MTIHLKTTDLESLAPKIAVIGVGGAGGNAVNNMIAAKLEGVSFICANTDAQALIHSKAETKIQLGVMTTGGRGAGTKPELGAAAAEESIEEIRSHLKGLHMVFIAAGMGGGTGTGAAPVIAAAAREEGVLTVGVVTKPFHFEGQRRMRSAEFGIELLSEQVDTLIVIPNQNLFRIAVVKTTFSEAFAMADQVLHDGISCITDVIVKEGIINLDFADVNLVMRGGGKAMIGTGEGSGENRGREAADAAISNPLLDDVTLLGANSLLVSIIGGCDDLTLYEVDEAVNRVREEVATNANIIIGTAFDETMDGEIRVSVVATGLDEAVQRVAPQSPVQEAAIPAASDQSLAGRLDSMNVASPAIPSTPPIYPGEPFAGSHRERSMEQPVPQMNMGGEVAQSLSPTDFTDQAVRMPSLEDFPPVGQAILRERQEGYGNGHLAPGIETHKQSVGFFERLSVLFSGGGLLGRKHRTVAKQPQMEVQLARGITHGGGAYLDPHVKGKALAPHSQMSDAYQGENEEVTEFPSFLRK